VMATADVEPYDLDGSKLFKVLIETDPTKRMPMAPQPPVPFDQVNLIAKWILQGAQNLTCDDTIAPGGCDTTGVSFAQFIKPLLQTNCQGCHSGSAPSAGVLLTTHAGIKAAAVSGRLHGAIARLPGYKPMPFNGDQLPQCTIDKVKAWVDAGAPNN
jgi:cytochrome c5